MALRLAAAEHGTIEKHRVVHRYDDGFRWRTGRTDRMTENGQTEGVLGCVVNLT